MQHALSLRCNAPSNKVRLERFCARASDPASFSTPSIKRSRAPPSPPPLQLQTAALTELLSIVPKQVAERDLPDKFALGRSSSAIVSQRVQPAQLAPGRFSVASIELALGGDFEDKQPQQQRQRQQACEDIQQERQQRILTSLISCAETPQDVEALLTQLPHAGQGEQSHAASHGQLPSTQQRQAAQTYPSHLTFQTNHESSQPPQTSPRIDQLADHPAQLEPHASSHINHFHITAAFSRLAILHADAGWSGTWGAWTHHVCMSADEYMSLQQYASRMTALFLVQSIMSAISCCLVNLCTLSDISCLLRAWHL